MYTTEEFFWTWVGLCLFYLVVIGMWFFRGRKRQQDEADRLVRAFNRMIR